MLRKIMILLGLCFVFAGAAHAQLLSDKLDVFGGYSYMRFSGSPAVNTNGWELSGEYKLTSWIGGVADLDGHYGSGARINSFLFGPQISLPAPVSPFAHLLIGASHFSTTGYSDTAFAVGLGVGIDAHIAPQISWRIIEGDYLPTRFGGQTQSNTRVSTGIVIHF